MEVGSVLAGAGELFCFGERFGGEVAGCVVEGDGAEQELRVADFQAVQQVFNVTGTRSERRGDGGAGG